MNTCTACGNAKPLNGSACKHCRQARADVRNPLLALPAVADLLALPGGSKAALAAVPKDISKDARERADKAWRTHKAPMAAYWKAVAVYANHTARVLRREAA